MRAYSIFAAIGVCTAVSLWLGKPGFDNLSWSITILDVVVLIIALTCLLVMNAIIAHFSPSENRISGSLFSIIVFILFATIVEEMFFRGVIQARYGIWIAAIGFAIMHCKSIPYFIGALIAGLILGISFSYTGSMTIPLIIHVVHNIIVVMLSKSINNENCIIYGYTSR
ncbi:CPBP family intramembrane metalloprotease [Candidatus Pacearchaeota archaeon]|nr:CPBP family intramembrane metalloprotease [Candidatus Pacearchaeota archaeon]